MAVVKEGAKQGGRREEGPPCAHLESDGGGVAASAQLHRLREKGGANGGLLVCSQGGGACEGVGSELWADARTRVHWRQRKKWPAPQGGARRTVIELPAAEPHDQA